MNFASGGVGAGNSTVLTLVPYRASCHRQVYAENGHRPEMSPSMTDAIKLTPRTTSPSACLLLSPTLETDFCMDHGHDLAREGGPNLSLPHPSHAAPTPSLLPTQLPAAMVPKRSLQNVKNRLGTHLCLSPQSKQIHLLSSLAVGQAYYAERVPVSTSFPVLFLFPPHPPSPAWNGFH